MNQLPFKRETLTIDPMVPEQTRETYPFFNPTEYQGREAHSPTFGTS